MPVTSAYKPSYPEIDPDAIVDGMYGLVIPGAPAAEDQTNPELVDR